MSDESDLTKIISSANTLIATSCKQFLDSLPQDDKSYQHYLNTYSFTGSSIGNVIKNAALHGCKTLDSSFTVFESFFPRIRKTTNEPPKRENGKPYFTEFLKIDWSDELIKSPLAFFMHKCLSQFMIEMLSLNIRVSNEDVKSFTLKFIRYVSTINPPTNDIEKISLIAMMELWSIVMYLLSEIKPKIVWKIFKKEVLDLPDMNDYTKTYFYVSFSSISLANGFKDDAEAILSNFVSILSQKTNNHTFCQHCVCFIHNLIYQLNKISKWEFNDPINLSIFAEALNQFDFNPEAFYLVSHLSNSIESTSFPNLMSFINYFDEVKSEMKPYFIKSLKYKLIGGKSASPVEIRLKHTNYSWSDKELTQPLDDIYKFMQNNDGQLQEYGNDLAEVVEQMIIVNTPYFLKNILPQMEYYQTTRTNICCALYFGLHLFFSNAESFSELNEFAEHLKKLEENAIRLVLGFLQTLQSEKSICNVCYDTPSLASILSISSSVKDQSIILKDQIKKLKETSKPIYSEETNYVDIHDLTNQITMNADHEMGKAYQSATINDLNSQDDSQDDLQVAPINNDLQNVLSLAVYLDLDDDTIKLLCHTVLAQCPTNGSMAVRVLQALIHIHKDYTEKIIQYLCDYFLSNEITFVSIQLIINAICLTLESANYEGFILSDKAMSRICFVAILGFCIPSPTVHQKIFDFCRMLAFLKTPTFYLQNFFEKHEDELSLDAMRRAAQAIMIIGDNDIKLLTPATFHDVSLSNVPIFYLFYLSSFGHYIRMYNEGFGDSITNAIKVLSAILFSMPANKVCSSFGLNCLTLLLSIAGKMNDFNFRQLQRVCTYIIRKYSSMNHQTNPIVLISIFSGMTQNIYEGLIPLFSQASLSISRAFAFVTMEMIRKNMFTVLHDNKVTNTLYCALHACLMLCYSKYINSRLLFEPGTREVDTFSQFHLFLDDFGGSLLEVFDRIMSANYIRSKPLFICSNSQIKKDIDHPFNSHKWFIFFCNLVSMNNTLFCNNIMAAFNKWIAISNIPDSYFHILMEKLPVIGKVYPEISTTIFRKNPGNLLPFYIAHARNNFHMFIAIANQIISSNIPSEKLVTERISFRYGDIEYLYYKNCGSLMALALFYMISKNIDRRIVAQKFLLAIVLIIGLFRKDPISAAGVHKFLDRKEDTILNSFSVFLQRDFEALNFILSTRFKFCGEQFANECLNIVKMIKTDLKFGKVPPSKSMQSLSQLSNTSRKKRLNNSHRYSVKNSRNSVLGINVDLNFNSNQVYEKHDHIVVEKPQILTSLIAAWLNPISFDLHKIGICRDCEEDFRVFGIYSFVNGLLTLCSVQGMTQSLADILDILIENNPGLFTLCLYDLQTNSESNSKSATLFLVYLYNKKPEAFIKIIKEYLRVPSWYFYEIQVSKVDQLFDITKLLDLKPKKDKSGSLDESSEDQTFEIDYDQVIKFTLNLIEECRKENESRFAEIRSYVLIFCLIHNETYSDIANILIENITHIKPNNINSSGIASQMFVQNVHKGRMETWKLSDIVPFIDGSERFLLEWGLTCGDLTAASIALQIYDLKDHILPDEAIPTFLNAIQSVSLALTERTDPSKKNQFGQWLIRVVGDNTRTNYEAVVSWLCACLKVLVKYVKYSEKTDIRMQIESFWTAVAFLQCHSIEYNSLFVNALQIVNEFLSNDKLRSKLKESHSCRFQAGLIPLLLEVKTQDKDSITSIFVILSSLLENELIFLLSPQESAPYISLFALLPYFWMKFNHLQTSKEHSNRISQYIHGSKALSDLLIQVGYYDTANATVLTNLVKYLFEKITEDELHLILRFYSQVMRNGTSAQKECIFIICDSILSIVSNITSMTEEISVITTIAVTDTTMQNSPNVLKFLRDLCIREVRVTQPTATTSGRSFTMFPTMDICDKRNLLEWEPAALDVFSEYAYYPPLFITDPGFNGSVFLSTIKKSIDKIVTVPFNEWYELLFKAQLQSVSRSSEMKDERLSTVEVRAREFIRIFNENFESSSNGGRKLSIDSRRMSRIEALFKKEIVEYSEYFVDHETFYITEDEINTLIPPEILKIFCEY
ncbi:hypothetical protein TRFO_17283 [Tritrichomonas foetus]|uniref:Uncharacterized protein n=1 Tax=Tritrichomonas foetus TaxID=1144522 RepID=A0A1J4KNX1_9EUKA|nr:hypothetical protein TRFO_17283 [Tritrichomonas foetus]|eukprot:OHT12810.1 hypothetical protein TRFO_17283 [Tritrichomonas foetus]